MGTSTEASFDAFHAADGLEDDARDVLAVVEYGVDGAERRFHDAAGDSEDGSGSRRGAERAVVVFLRQVLEVDTGVLYHARELAGREDCRRRVCPGCSGAAGGRTRPSSRCRA